MIDDEKHRKQRIADKKFRQNHLEQFRGKDKRRYEENRESELARNKAYYPSYYEKNRDRLKHRTRNTRHQVTQEWVNKKTEEQNNCCAICLKPFQETPHIDHNHGCCCSSYHSCDKCRRDLLCKDCNLGLGRFKEDIQILENAIQYVQRHKKGNVDGSSVQHAEIGSSPSRGSDQISS